MQFVWSSPRRQLPLQYSRVDFRFGRTYRSLGQRCSSQESSRDLFNRNNPLPKNLEQLGDGVAFCDLNLARGEDLRHQLQRVLWQLFGSGYTLQRRLDLG